MCGISGTTGALCQTGVYASGKYYWFTDCNSTTYNRASTNFLNDSNFHLFDCKKTMTSCNIYRNIESSYVITTYAVNVTSTNSFSIGNRVDNNGKYAIQFTSVMYLNTLITMEEKKLLLYSFKGTLLVE